MLSAGCLHGVNDALNCVNSLNASTSTQQHFGGKVVVVSGDLYQLPAVEAFRRSDQVFL